MKDKTSQRDVDKAIRDTLFKILESINILIESMNCLNDVVVKLAEREVYEFPEDASA